MRPSLLLLPGLAVLLPLASLPALAQGIADPTRPPMVAAAASGASAPARAASAVHAPVLRVLSVQLPQEGRASALMTDRLVFVGDRIGGGTVTSIDAQGIELRDAHGKPQRLRLIDAAIVKQTVLPAGPATAPVASLGRGGTQP
jgi:MSHA biogenesis protein MshK